MKRRNEDVKRKRKEVVAGWRRAMREREMAGDNEFFRGRRKASARIRAYMLEVVILS